jgi:hypothetical protein
MAGLIGVYKNRAHAPFEQYHLLAEREVTIRTYMHKGAIFLSFARFGGCRIATREKIGDEHSLLYNGHNSKVKYPLPKCHLGILVL